MTVIEEGPTLLQLARAAARRWPLLLLGVALGGGAGYLYGSAAHSLASASVGLAVDVSREYTHGLRGRNFVTDPGIVQNLVQREVSFQAGESLRVQSHPQYGHLTVVVTAPEVEAAKVRVTEAIAAARKQMAIVGAEKPLADLASMRQRLEAAETALVEAEAKLGAGSDAAAEAALQRRVVIKAAVVQAVAVRVANAEIDTYGSQPILTQLGPVSASTIRVGGTRWQRAGQGALGGAILAVIVAFLLALRAREPA